MAATTTNLLVDIAACRKNNGKNLPASWTRYRHWRWLRKLSDRDPVIIIGASSLHHPRWVGNRLSPPRPPSSCCHYCSTTGVWKCNERHLAKTCGRHRQPGNLECEAYMCGYMIECGRETYQRNAHSSIMGTVNQCPGCFIVIVNALGYNSNNFLTPRQLKLLSANCFPMRTRIGRTIGTTEWRPACNKRR
jgi:hypothetical protein